MQQSKPETDRAVSWKKIWPNIAEDQRDVWLFPTKVEKERNWIPVAAVLGATAGFIALDPVEAHYFRTTSTYRGFNHVFTSNATGIGIMVAPVCPGCLYQWTETVCLHCHQIEVSLV